MKEKDIKNRHAHIYRLRNLFGLEEMARIELQPQAFEPGLVLTPEATVVIANTRVMQRETDDNIRHALKHRNMKRHSEERTEAGVGMLLKTLTRNWYDTGILLDEFEATHTESERERSRHYAALVAGHYALKEAMDRINNQLNKK